MSIVDSGCGFAILTHCVDSTTTTNDDDGMVVPSPLASLADEDDWTKVMTTSPLFCDLDFASEAPMAFEGSSPGHDHATHAAAAFFSYSSRQLSPCGLNSVFVVQSLLPGQALIDISKCRMRVDGAGLLPLAVLQTNLQWKAGMGHVRVAIDVSTAKQQYLDLQQQARRQAIQVVSSGMGQNKNAGEFRREACAMQLENPFESPPLPPVMPTYHHVPDADALHKLKVMVRDEMNDMHHVLVAMGVAAVFLIVAFVWTLWQIYKPKTPPPQQQQQQYLTGAATPPTSQYRRPAMHRGMVPISLDSKFRQQETSIRTSTDDAAASLSPCSKLELQLALRRRLQQGNPGRKTISRNTRRVMSPIPTNDKYNPFATTAMPINATLVMTPLRAVTKSKERGPQQAETPVLTDDTKSKSVDSEKQQISQKQVLTPELRDEFTEAKAETCVRDENDDQAKLEIQSFIQDYWAA